MSRMLFVHGIESDGSEGTDRLCRRLGETFETVEVDYPRVHWWNARWRGVQLDRAQTILDASTDGDHMVAHSFGGLLVRRCMQLGRQFGAVILFSPADAADTYYPILGARRICVVHNPFDRAIAWGARLWTHDFGRLGADGYRGPPDPRVESTRAIFYRQGDHRHGFYFAPDRIDRWVRYVTERARAVDAMAAETAPAGEVDLG